MIKEFSRTGSFELNFSKSEIFPLLCPKMEEKWIPNWECQVLFSLSGYNETGAVFKTEKPFGTELIWYTNEFNQETGDIEFTNFAQSKFIFNFIIQVKQLSEKRCRLTFTHRFKAISFEGSELIKAYETEDFQDRLTSLGKLIELYLKRA
jgi:hypothetical protein